MKIILNSKWTAKTPQNKEKHFVVIKVNRDSLDPQIIISVVIQAVMTKKEYTLNPNELNSTDWSIGWL